VEAKCFRFLSHSTDDDDRAYRDRTAIEEARKHDPVPVFERLLLDHGVLDEERVKALKADVLRDTNDATDTAESFGYPSPSDLYTNVYEGPYEPWQ
jgi:TPP-dependent pyruvate/acetoin dehydrogenase alpha subunit